MGLQRKRHSVKTNPKHWLFTESSVQHEETVHHIRQKPSLSVYVTGLAVVKAVTDDE